MKIVNKLKKKHRNDYWLDVDGFLWFWNADAEQWWFLNPVLPMHLCSGPGDGFLPVPSIDTGDAWPDAPFTRVR